MNDPLKLSRFLVLWALAWALTPAWAQPAFQASPQASLPQASAPIATHEPAPADELRFDILEIDVEGNSVLSPLEIERAVSPFLGPDRGFADVESARKALEDAYQRVGYQTVFAEIPEQKIQNGVVRLHVIEGTVDRTNVVGARYFSLGDIRARAPDLMPGSVPDLLALQQELARLNRGSDRQVAPILKPGRTPGTVDVDLSVKDQFPLHGEFEADNRAAAFTRPLRLNAALHYDNLWQREHSLGLNFQTSPQDTRQVNVLYGTYLWKFQDRADVLSLYAVRSNSNIAIVGSSTVLGQARIAGTRWIHPFGSGASYFHSLTAGLDYKDFGQTNISAQTGAPDTLPPIHYLPFSLGYSGTWSGALSQLQFTLTASSAPRGILGNSDAAFAGRRVVASASYVTLKYDLSYDRRVGSHVDVYAKIDGQSTGDALIPNEQFAGGGAESVRGYRESEILGDTGEHGSLEVRASPYAWNSAADGPFAYGFVFFDAASVRTINPQGPQLSTPTADISSCGLGVRASGWRGLRLDLDLGHALRDGALGVNGTITRRGMNRANFSMALSF